ncbi:MAG: ATP-dependent helicase [Sulfurihydrogenibium sp.]|jgi:SNF2 family DNA or RNA helicase|nr:MAG: ATP-dependent helicase [Sulfurihydrogenibium sp.]
MIKIYKLSIDILEKLEIFKIDCSNINYQISENLFKEIESIKLKGKIYNLKEDSVENENINKKLLKSKKSSKNYKNLSLFDLIKPILTPEVSFDIPTDLNFPHKLFDYQIQGIKFLLSNKAALLADQMGTGKTVMTTTALRILFIKGLVKKALIVAPSNLLNVWEEHIEKWAPELKYITLNDSKETRKLMYDVKSHVYIISYDTIKNDYKDSFPKLKAFFKDLDIIILDEAHNIKNKETYKSKAIKTLSKEIKYRWALSGTPLQNNIKEIISLLEFLLPEEKNIEKNSIEEIKDKLKSIMLRRLKKDVLKELPEKLPPEIEKFELSPIQKEYYEKYLNYEKNRLLDIYARFRYEKNFPLMFKQNIIFSLQKLRQICNFPPDSHHSPKANRLKEIVKELTEQKEKVVIFSNFIHEGIDKIYKNLIEILPKKSIEVFHGSLSQKEKEIAVKRFMEDDECYVFLGSINAAGEGLTLTKSSYLIFFDLHWNPAKVWQAEDRIHRIGQTKAVNIYNFITKNTVEEKILQKLEEKRKMINSLIDENISEIESVSLEELIDLIGLANQKIV